MVTLAFNELMTTVIIIKIKNNENNSTDTYKTHNARGTQVT